MAPFNYKSEYERYKKYYLSLTPLFTKPTNQAYTTIIFSFLVVSLFGWYAIRPTMQTIFELKRQISDKTNIDKKLEDKISSLIEAQAAYENAQSYLPLVSEALPDNPQALQAAQQVKKLADASDLSIVNISIPTLPLAKESTPATKSAALTTSEFPITLTVSGAYSGIKSFIAELSNLRRIIRAENLSFTSRRASPTTATDSASATGTAVQVDLKLTLFFLPG